MNESASIQFLTQGVAPVGALLAGMVAGYFGVRLTLLVAVLGILVAGFWLLLSPVRTVRASDVLPAEP